MDDLVSRKKVLDEIFAWFSKGENEREDAIKLIGERIRSIPPEDCES